MRVGEKIIPLTSGVWRGHQVGRQVTLRQDVASVTQRSAAPSPSGLSVQAMRVRTVWLALDKAKEILREAFREEANDGGPFTQAILDIQNSVDDGMAGCGALMVGIKERQEGGTDGK